MIQIHHAHEYPCSTLLKIFKPHSSIFNGLIHHLQQNSLLGINATGFLIGNAKKPVVKMRYFFQVGPIHSTKASSYKALGII